MARMVISKVKRQMKTQGKISTTNITDKISLKYKVPINQCGKDQYSNRKMG